VQVQANILERAHHLADDLLFARALATDAAELVPLELLDEMAAAGMYGLFGPTEAGGLEASPPTADRVIEILAGGCLTTTFVCMQHLGVVATVAAAGEALREEWLTRLCSGEVRSGVAFAGLRRPGPPVMTVRESPGGYVLDGNAPWVTGWGRIDLVHVAARNHAGDVFWFLLDTGQREGLRVEPLRLAAVNASGTVTMYLDGLFVPAERLSRCEAVDDWRARDAAGLRRNGSLALGVAGRAATLLGEESALRRQLDERIDQVRGRLDTAVPGDAIATARAAASQVALDAATSLVVAGGGRSLLLDQHAQRLAREALFLLVFGQTPAIREVQLGAAQVRPS
jgi:alkylation response protein AidB-like acyl-CoA dehydrogenase